MERCATSSSQGSRRSASNVAALAAWRVSLATTPDVDAVGE